MLTLLPSNEWAPSQRTRFSVDMLSWVCFSLRRKSFLSIKFKWEKTNATGEKKTLWLQSNELLNVWTSEHTCCGLSWACLSELFSYGCPPTACNRVRFWPLVSALLAALWVRVCGTGLRQRPLSQPKRDRGSVTLADGHQTVRAVASSCGRKKVLWQTTLTSDLWFRCPDLPVLQGRNSLIVKCWEGIFGCGRCDRR